MTFPDDEAHHPAMGLIQVGIAPELLIGTIVGRRRLKYGG